MATTFSMRSLLGALPATSRTSIRPTTQSPITSHHPTSPRRPLLRALSTTPTLHARVGKKVKPVKPDNNKKKSAAATAARQAAKKKKKDAEADLDPKVVGMMRFLYAPTQTPAPLRMARNRHVRHWTIHRAWQLLQRKKDEALHRELMQMQQSMSHACETLRTMEGPGGQGPGWLFRRSMEKIGVWGLQAIPIEYARPMVDTPGEKPWNHEWKREWKKA